MLSHLGKLLAITAVLILVLTFSLPLSPPTATAAVVSPDGWEWQNPLPQGNPLRGVWSNSPSDVFAVGPGGTIIHYDGSTWTGMDCGITPTFFGEDDLNAVWGNSPDDVFAVGAYGNIVHYNGSSWSEMTTGVSDFLISVWGSSSSDVFAVGEYDTILHYDGNAEGTWSEMDSGLTISCDLYGVCGNSSSDVFAVGWEGTILHYDGMDWSSIDHGETTEWLTGVWCSPSSDDVFVVGGDGVVLHSGDNGATWESMPKSAWETYYGIWGSSPDNVFAIEWDPYTANIHHYNGVAWTKVESYSLRLNGICGTSSSDIYVVGESGTILHYGGSDWSWVSTGHAEGLRDIWGSSLSDVFAVGGEGTILHYDGSSWSPMDSGTSQWLRGVWGSSPSDVYAVGDVGTILHYDGNIWSPIVVSGVTENLQSVWGSSSSDVFVVGYWGRIVHYDGENWDLMDSGTGYWLRSVWGSSSSDVFAVGSNRTILHYDGNEDGTWEAMDVPSELDTLEAFYGVWGSSSNDVYAVTWSGKILHYASPWTVMFASTEAEWLYGVCGSSEDNIFFMGQDGVILHWNGSELVVMNSGTTNGLDSVYCISPSFTVAVGQSGTILNLSEQEPPTVIGVSPNTGKPGETLEDVVISGLDFDNVTGVSFGSGITVVDFTPVDSYQITATISINDDAELGFRTVTVTTAGGSGNHPLGFKVGEGPHTIDSVSPNSARPGDVINVTVTGSGLEYLDDVSYWSFGNGISVDNVEVVNDTQVNLSISIDPTATVGSRDVSVTSGIGTGKLEGGFTVAPAPLDAEFSATPTEGEASLTVHFTDESTGEITSWAWDFDNDGKVDSTEQNPTHTYVNSGTYTVSLTVTGPDGSSDTETKVNYIDARRRGASDPTECGCPFTGGSTSTGELLTGWGIIGLCWGGGYYLVRRSGRRKII